MACIKKAVTSWNFFYAVCVEYSHGLAFLFGRSSRIPPYKSPNEGTNHPFTGRKG